VSGLVIAGANFCVFVTLPVEDELEIHELL
jgi:hypothetical protein